MDLSIMFPMFWGREKKQVVQDGDYFYDHPTALDDEGMIWRFVRRERSQDQDRVLGLLYYNRTTYR